MTSSSRSWSRAQTPMPLETPPPSQSYTMSLTARLSNIIASQTEDWVRQSAETHIAARIAGVHFDLEPPTEVYPTAIDDNDLDPLTTPSSPLYPRSIRSSSMAPSALIHQSSTPSAYPPSLRSCFTEATPTETSISTELANHFGGVPLLEDNNGVLEIPRPANLAPVFECAFWFLSCTYISPHPNEWTTHCLAHFRGEEPPHTVQCPLCDWTYTCDNGWTSWSHRMTHLAEFHTMLGQTLRTSRPDFGLFQHLWRKRLIDTQDLKELNGGNHNLERVPGNFVETGRRTERRERDERRHRRQHVSAVRQGGPQRR